jgi:hypothetical protein
MRVTNGIPLGSPLPLTGWHCKIPSKRRRQHHSCQGGRVGDTNSVRHVCSRRDGRARFGLYGAPIFGQEFAFEDAIDPTPARLKLLHACDQSQASRVFTFLPIDTEKLRPNTEGDWGRGV